MEVKDLAGFGDAFKKLVEVLEKGLGRLTRSHFERKDADSKAYELNVIAKAIREANDTFESLEYSDGKFSIKAIPVSPKAITETSLDSIQKRAEYRSNYQLARQQQNIESVTSLAAEQMIEEKLVSNDPVSDDWVSRFFEITKDISNEEMQKLWSKILSGEVKQPGSFSLRTLDFIKNLSRDDAKLIERLASYVIDITGGQRHLIFSHGNSNEKFLELSKLTFLDLLALQEIGICEGVGQSLELTVSSLNPLIEAYIVYQDRILFLEAGKAAKFPIVSLTKVGRELTTIAMVEFSQEYFNYIGQKVIEQGVSVSEARVVQKSKENFSYSFKKPFLT